MSAETVASLASLTETGRLTVLEGWLESLTVNVASPPGSLRFPLTAPTRTPELSSSSVATATSCGSRPL